MVERRRGTPSPVWGVRRAVDLWRLIAACWAVSFLVFAPALLVLRTTIFRALAAVPGEAGAAPPGDIALIIIEAGWPILPPLGLAVVSGIVVLWLWTVLWHAGVVAWQLWTGGRRVRLGEVLGLGMVAWWRYIRLSLTALVALVLLGIGIWLPLASAIRTSLDAMNEQRMMLLLVVGLGITKLMAIVVWIATMHGAWLLGLPEYRSAVLSWVRGLGSAIRTPFSSFFTWLVWLVPAWLAAVVPLAFGIRFDGLRGSVALIVLSLAAGLVRSICWVGMFNSFAPVTGLVGGAEDEEAQTAESARATDARRPANSDSHILPTQPTP